MRSTADKICRRKDTGQHRNRKYPVTNRKKKGLGKKIPSYLWDSIKQCNITRGSRSEEEGTQKKYLQCHEIPDNIPI